MIVLKFGGTSVADADAMRRAAALVPERGGEAPVVVVSAVAGATRALLDMGRQAASGSVDPALSALGALTRRHLELIEQVGGAGAGAARDAVRALHGELEPLLRGIGLLRELAPSTRDAVAGFGERLSSPAFACALTAQGTPCRVVDVRDVMITDARFGNARPLMNLVREGAARVFGPARSTGEAIVTQGFIGRTREGRPTTMGFEASDYTATLLGAALGASEVQIWTDVSGMMTADPRVVDRARPVPLLRFEDAAELALLGAKVLHPRSMAPVRAASVPVRILNSGAPSDPGTRIGPGGSDTTDAVTSVALLEEVALLQVRPEVRDEGMLRAVAAAVDASGAALRLATASPLGTTAIVDHDADPRALTDPLRSLGEVRLDPDVAAVSLVGSGLGNAQVLAQAVSALGDVPIHALIQGASPHSVSMVVPTDAGAMATCRLHAAFFETEP